MNAFDILILHYLALFASVVVSFRYFLRSFCFAIQFRLCLPYVETCFVLKSVIGCAPQSHSTKAEKLCMKIDLIKPIKLSVKKIFKVISGGAEEKALIKRSEEEKA